MVLYHFSSTAVPGRNPYLIVKPTESLKTQQHASHFLGYKNMTVPQLSRNLDCDHKRVPITSHRHAQWLLHGMPCTIYKRIQRWRQWQFINAENNGKVSWKKNLSLCISSSLPIHSNLRGFINSPQAQCHPRTLECLKVAAGI